MPVWIADTPRNVGVIRECRRTVGGSVTSFSVDLNSAPDFWCAAVLADVELHHGKFSQDPPHGRLEVIGSGVTPNIRSALADIQFMVVVANASSFVAERHETISG